MKCTDFHAEFLAGGMSRAADAHLAGCSACRSQLAELRSLRSVIEDPATWEQPSPDLEGRVVQTIEGLAGPPDVGVQRWPAFVAIAAALALVAATISFMVSTRPDWTLALSPTEFAPLASATVDGWNTDFGTRMRLDVDGLEPLGASEYYEIWLTAPDGRHVSAGTFNASGEIEATIAVRRSDFPRVWITVEANDDDESLQGLTVLDTSE